METKDNSKTLLVIIAILLLIIGVGVGYFVGTNKNESTNTKETNKEEKKEEKNEAKTETDEEEEKAPTIDEGYVPGSITSYGEVVNKEIELNGKKNNLAIMDGSKHAKNSYMTFGSTNIDKLVHYGVGRQPKDSYEMPQLNYIIVKGTDNKEYLVVNYNLDFQHVLLVLNDETKIIGEVVNTIDAGGSDCFTVLDDSTENYFVILNNEISYYKVVDNKYKQYSESYFQKGGVNFEMFKLEIGNNTVKEIKVNSTTTGKLAQCT